MSEAPPPLHRVLARQLRRLNLTQDSPPDDAGWAALVDIISQTYAQSDIDRYTLERSIDVSSAEMRGLHDVLSDRASHDALTGLPNRAALMERLRDLIDVHRHGGAPSAVLFIDLDGFKLVNDSLGHEAGDELLVRAAERIRSTAGPSNLVTRLGGDEFVIVCPQAGSLDDLCGLARQIVSELETPFRIGGRDAVVSASIGVSATAPHDAAEDVLRRADLALYSAKTSGRARFVLFDDAMQKDVDSRMSIKTALRTALGQDELFVQYQPVVRLSDLRVVGAEALARWNRAGSIVMPGDFIPVAEESRLIADIDSWVIRHACLRSADWCQAGADLAVNLSPRTLATDDAVELISQALHATGIAPHRLIVELTEATLLTPSPMTEASLAGLRSLGVRLAIDDFGTGYASFDRLRTVAVDVLKLDRSLIEDIDQHEDVVAIVGAAISMGHAMGHTVVAEGVERRAQADLLRAMGCDLAQGYLFGRPGAPELIDAAVLRPDRASHRA